MNDIRILEKNKVDILEIKKYYKIENYLDLCEKIKNLVQEGIIKPIKASKTNGKSPSLYNKYTIIRDNDEIDYYYEILNKINHKLDTSKYLKNQKLYKSNRKDILMLSNFIDKNMDKLNTKISINERSFQIFGREKFILKNGGMALIKSLGLDEEFLNVYDTTEPLSYYSKDKNTPQNILIIENKDTFYSMRNFVINNKKIFDEEISTIIYGGGKGIYKSFRDFDLCVEPYLSNKNNKFIYLGDLDYEGIIIYEKLSDIFKVNFKIYPFIEGYKKMISKYKNLNFELPISSENQNKNTSGRFFDFFDPNIKYEIINILNCGSYIPQEILNIEDF
ncbi:MAG: DUF2220 family protein [Bacilli bacterium]